MSRLKHRKEQAAQANKITNLYNKLVEIDNRIGFSHIVDMMSTLSLNKKSTKSG